MQNSLGPLAFLLPARPRTVVANVWLCADGWWKEAAHQAYLTCFFDGPHALALMLLIRYLPTQIFSPQGSERSRSELEKREKWLEMHARATHTNQD